ncbi:MAG: hypothetical protein H0X63_09820 [Flavobacteriales bacterium]|jgi:hypothetical protein|nr:hypothetical protein [Flavobacteriales bacterium]
MKIIKFLTIIAVIFSAVSCDPEDCADYLIQNNSPNDIELVFYGETNSNAIIEKNRQFTQATNCATGTWRFRYFEIDSIQIKADDLIRKTYYPNGNGKNIFKTQDRDSWKLVESREHYSKFVFEITDEDLQ